MGGLHLVLTTDGEKGFKHRKHRGLQVFFRRRAHVFDEHTEDLYCSVFRGWGGVGGGWGGCLHQQRSISSLVHKVNFSGESFACEAAIQRSVEVS